MCDTSKNHVLDSLSTSENRMEKFLPVQKLVGLDELPLGTNVTILRWVAQG